MSGRRYRVLWFVYTQWQNYSPILHRHTGRSWHPTKYCQVHRPRRHVVHQAAPLPAHILTCPTNVHGRCINNWNNRELDGLADCFIGEIIPDGLRAPLPTRQRFAASVTARRTAPAWLPTRGSREGLCRGCLVVRRSVKPGQWRIQTYGWGRMTSAHMKTIWDPLTNVPNISAHIWPTYVPYGRVRRLPPTVGPYTSNMGSKNPSSTL